MNRFRRSCGFTIVEVLIVVLVIGILSSLAIGNYSSAISDTRLRSAQDRIQTFFKSCKDRAKLRRVCVKLVYDEKLECLRDSDSTTTFLRVPELHSQSVPKLIEIDKLGQFTIAGKESNKLSLSLKNPDGKLATIIIDL